jgi:hypothetical protein
MGIGLGVLRGAAGSLTPPVITGTPLLTDDEITVTGDLPMTFYSVTTASATPPSAATIKATPDDTIVLSGGVNYMPPLDLEITVGTWYLHYLVSNAVGDSAIQTESYVISAPPIQYVGGKSFAFDGTTGTTAISLTDLTGGLAAAPAENDLVIIAYQFGGFIADPDRDVTISTGGYTEVADLFQTGNVGYTNFGVFRKFMSASPDTTVSVGQTFDAAYSGAVAIHVWRGVNLATPMDVTATTASLDQISLPTPPAITPTTADTIIIVAGGGSYPSASGAVFTTGTLSNFQTAYFADTIAAAVGMGSYEWTSGTYTPAQFGGNNLNNNGSWGGVTLALRKA